MKKVYIETYGCQMNEYDTEIVKAILKKEDYHFAAKPEDADVLFLNTCSVRENAHQKVQQRISVLKQLKRSNKKLVLGVLGCMAQNLKKDLLEKNVGVDLVAGPDSYKKLPSMIKHVSEENAKEFSLSLSEYETYSDIFPDHTPGVNAWIAVMRGCDNFCTFCVVPYTRGRERSLPLEEVLAEARAALASAMEFGFVDLLRLHNDEDGQYSYFDYRNPRAIEHNSGWRVDLILATKALAKRSTACWASHTCTRASTSGLRSASGRRSRSRREGAARCRRPIICSG